MCANNSGIGSRVAVPADPATLANDQAVGRIGVEVFRLSDRLGSSRDRERQNYGRSNCTREIPRDKSLQISIVHIILTLAQRTILAEPNYRIATWS